MKITELWHGVVFRTRRTCTFAIVFLSKKIILHVLRISISVHHSFLSISYLLTLLRPSSTPPKYPPARPPSAQVIMYRLAGRRGEEKSGDYYYILNLKGCKPPLCYINLSLKHLTNPPT